jgi:translation initiation factor 1
MSPEDRPTVYSSEAGDLRSKKPGRTAGVSQSLPPGKQMASIRRETKGRGGKTVTVVYNLQLTDPHLAALAKQLKQVCGTGGTVKDGAIEIQGDHREKIAARLRQLGYPVKFTGG